MLYLAFALFALLVLIMALYDYRRAASRRARVFLGIVALLALVCALLAGFLFYKTASPKLALFVQGGLAAVESKAAPAIEATNPITDTLKIEVDTTSSDAAVARVTLPSIENGINKATVLEAPKGQYLLVNYGYEARDPKTGKELAGCGAALVYPGETITVTIWDGTPETLDGGEVASVAYAQSVLVARMKGDAGCAYWADPIGFSLPADAETK